MLVLNIGNIVVLEFNGAPIAGSTLRSDRQRRSLRPVGPTPQREHTEGKRRLFGLLGFIGLFGFVGFIEDEEFNEAKRPTVNR